MLLLERRLTGEVMAKELQRRIVLGAAIVGAALLKGRAFAQTEKLISWTDIPPPVPEQLQNVVKGITRWEDLDSWITPNDKWFSIAHYKRPQIDPETCRLDIAGWSPNQPR